MGVAGIFLDEFGFRLVADIRGDDGISGIIGCYGIIAIKISSRANSRIFKNYIGKRHRIAGVRICNFTANSGLLCNKYRR